jgi:hypothetical protein
MLCLTYFVSLCDTSFRFVSFLHFPFRFVSSFFVSFRCISFRFVSFSFLSLVVPVLYLVTLFRPRHDRPTFVHGVVTLFERWADELFIVRRMADFLLVFT